MAEKKSRQESYIEIQMIDQQLKQLQEYSENFEKQILSVNEILESLDDFEKAKPASKILVPLQNGIFIEANLGESKKVKVNVGNGTVVEKTLEEAREMMQKQAEAVGNYNLEILRQIDLLTSRMEELQKQVE